MFTQKLSIDCTQEQYEKHLKEELEKMGYEEYSLSGWNIKTYQSIANNFSEGNGKLGNIHDSNIEKYGRTYLGKFNAPLFLALAAMTDKKEGNYGEIWISINRLVGTDYFTQGKFEPSSIDGSWRFKFRKATVSEIMSKFGEPKTESITIAIDITNHSDEKRCYYGSEEQMISLLKAKGYKIFKQTTTLEEV